LPGGRQTVIQNSSSFYPAFRKTFAPGSRQATRRKEKLMRKHGLQLALLLALYLTSPAALDQPATAQANVTALVGVQVIPLDTERVLTAQTLLIRDGVLVELGDSATVAVPAGAQVINGCGLYVVPGLMDMHVHVAQADLPRYLAAGVTTVRNMWGTAQLQELFRRIDDGTLAGPKVYSAGTGVDGSTAFTNGPLILEDPARAESVVASQVSAGWDFIKVHQELKLAPYQALLAAAHRQNIRVLGHVPTRVPIEEALTLGQASLEHLTGYDVALNRLGGFWGPRAWVSIDEAKIPALVAQTVAAGAWNCPTLNAFDLLAPAFGATPAERTLLVQNRRRMTKALFDAGAKLLAGTDAGGGGGAPGTGLHDELAELVAAGLSPYAALRTATVNAAEFLGQSSQLGSLAVGQQADLLLLAENPLDDIRALAQIRGVLQRGKFVVPLTPAPCRNLASVSAASYRAEGASEAIVAAFGVNLASRTVTAPTLPLPTTLAGITLNVRDSGGTERPAPLFFVAPSQINYQLPAGMPSGTATLTVQVNGAPLAQGTLPIRTVAPGLFSANASGQGVAAALALRLRPDGTQTFEQVARFDAAQNRFVAVPLELGPAGEPMYLLLFGTGLRARSSSAAAVTATLGDVPAPVEYAGPQGELAGLDQINLQVPRALAGRGEVQLTLQVEGQAANPVTLSFR